MKKWLENFLTPSLWNGGERVDIDYNKEIVFERLKNIYEKAHLRRYEFALEQVGSDEFWGDFACGSAYGSAMLADKVAQVIGADIDEKTVRVIRKRYASRYNLSLQQTDLRQLNFNEIFDGIVSFETLEHFTQEDMQKVLANFHKALKPNGKLIFSTPYMEERSPIKIKMGFHFTFDIDEDKMKQWLTQNGFRISNFLYQNYVDYKVGEHLTKKDFLIGIAEKIA